MGLIKLILSTVICFGYVAMAGADEEKTETPAVVAKPEVKPDAPKKAATPAVPAQPVKKTAPAANPANKPAQPYVEHFDQEEQRRLMKLYQDDPAAYYTELGKLIGQLRKEEAELNQKLADAVNAYRQENDPEEKKKLLEKVKELTKQQFYFRLNETATRLKESEQRLAQLRKLYEARKKSAGSIIEKRVQYLISDPSQRW